ncbi:MFS general substrate transporter [Lentinula aff. lateritia]|uniref:MFS general substrate transporter n=1 Tax=Lentinula aff. lateritia TaxID=2804960 RepID=A0ACC1UG65_9AGAR|nr:MFS general substrate transporter [Lentinula aff. lateritia]
MQDAGISFLAGVLVLNATFSSSAPSGIADTLVEEFALSEEEVVTLTISLFVAGYCIGGLLWGPLSEGDLTLSRCPVFIFSFFCLDNVPNRYGASLLVFRFLGGVFAELAIFTVALVNTYVCSSSLSSKHSMPSSQFVGPDLGPTVAGLTKVSRRDTVCYAPMEVTRKIVSEQIKNILAHPFQMLFLDASIFCSRPLPIVFTEGHGFNAGILGLMYLPYMLGVVIVVIIMALIAAPIYAASFFWFVWTSSIVYISFWAPLIAGAAMGFGITWIFLNLFNYIIDTYLMTAASALAANTVVCSLFGAGFPLFASQMYVKLGPQWASSLLGSISLAMVPIPFIFLKYGAELREQSMHAVAKQPSSKPNESIISSA